MDTPAPIPSTRWWRLAALLALAGLIVAGYLTGLHDRAWEYARGHVTALREAAQANRPLAYGLFFLVYVACTSLSLPSSLVLSLLAGAMFGFVGGTVLVSVASTLGACVAFLLSRHLLRDSVQRRFGPRLEPLNRGVARDGAWYLLALRLTPAVPYFLINFALGLTSMPLATFAVVSWLGMLPVGMVIVHTGQTLESIKSPGEVFTPNVLIALALLAFAPLLLRWLMKRWLPDPVAEERPAP